MKIDNFLTILDKKGEVKFIYQNGNKCYALCATTSDSAQSNGQSYRELYEDGYGAMVWVRINATLYVGKIYTEGFSVTTYLLGHRIEVLLEWKDMGV